ncbi:MAG TPA: STAS domain-containing protein [Polyangiaceae bacterium]
MTRPLGLLEVRVLTSMSSVKRKHSPPRRAQQSDSGSTRLEVAGELTVSNVLGFRQKAVAALADCRLLVIDLKAADYLDASAFQCLEALRRQAQGQGTAIAFESVPDAILTDATTMGMSIALTSSRIPGAE